MFSTPCISIESITGPRADPRYRLAIATQNVAYNQPPNTSFFLGTGMKKVPKPDIALVKMK
jgi:rhamnogalacturonan endolyase